MYFQMKQTMVMEGLYMTKSPGLPLSVRWISGQRHKTPITEPIRVELDDTYGTELPDFFDDNIVLMSERMIGALRAAGVDNFDVYQVELVDTNRNKVIADYQAVQIIGRLKAADAAASDVFNPMGVSHTLQEFRKLKLDQNAARGLLMFRLYESADTIVVHEAVKAKLDEADLKYVSFVAV